MPHPLSAAVDQGNRDRRRDLARHSRTPHANYVDVVWRAGKLRDLELLDEASEARLAMLALAERPRARGVLARLRAAAGFALIQASNRLQEAPAAEPSHLGPH